MIRPASEADAPAISRLHLRVAWDAWVDIVDHDILGAQSAEADEPGWRGRIASNTAWVWDQAGEVAGYAEVGAANDDDAPPSRGHLFHLYVAPEAQGAGVGSALLRTAVDHLRGVGFAEATLWVFTANEQARRFYTAAGWVDDPAAVMPAGDEWWAPSVRLRTSL